MHRLKTALFILFVSLTTSCNITSAAPVYTDSWRFQPHNRVSLAAKTSSTRTPSNETAWTAPRAIVRTTFEGKVVSIKRDKFPSARMTLDLYQVGRSSVLRGRGSRGRLPVLLRPHQKNNVIPMTDPRNVNLAGAYYLQPGDPIKGSIWYNNGAWQLEAFMRVNSVSPPKVAALNVELSTDKQSYLLGEDVRMTLTVTNTGSASTVFHFRNGQRYDFAVRDGGKEIWRWSKERMFSQVLSNVALGPGDSLSFRELWPGVDTLNMPVDPGAFTVAGWITATGQTGITESTAEITLKEARGTGPTVEDLIRSPKSYLNRELSMEGVYRSQLAERGERLVEGGPPTSRNDWILKDETGSIYVAGNGGLLLDRVEDLNRRFRVHGLVRMNPEGRLYLRAWEVERITNRRRQTR